MLILGGFAGHGQVFGVTVEPHTLQRTCNDCGYSWPFTADEGIRRSAGCVDAMTLLRPRPYIRRALRSGREDTL